MGRPTKDQAELGFWLVIIGIGFAWAVVEDGWIVAIGTVLIVALLVLVVLPLGVRAVRKLGR